MADVYGAGQEAWHHWSRTLGLCEHLLPVVSNPGATISPDSKVQLLGKTPTQYNFRGEAAGIAKWTEQRTTLKQVDKYELEPDYGICIQSRQGGLRAIDIDVPSKKLSRQIVEAIQNALPIHNWMYRRTREGTGKLLLPFRFEPVMPKAVLQVDGGAIELLGEGQQWIVEGAYLVLDTHNETNSKQTVNGRYLWPAGRPPSLDHLPLLDEADLKDLMATLELLFGLKEWQVARAKREGQLVSTAPREGADSVANWLIENWEIRDDGSNGELFIRCPFDAEHTSDSGPTETVYYGAGTGGFERGHFKCLHAHCIDRTDDDYLQALGYDIADEFPIVEVDPGAEIEPAKPEPAKPEPRYMVDKQGRKEARAYNHELFLRDAETLGLEIAWDDFTAQMGYRKRGEKAWRPFNDEHYQTIVRQMDRNGFVTQQASTIRSAVNAHAMENRVDTLVDWVDALPKWDGVERVAGFWHRYGKAASTDYIEAISCYTWTALAGRALDPGCQADMVPILVGEQGVRKTSLVRAMAPDPRQYVEINLMHRDDDTTRKMRGKVIGELGELRGLQSRDKEDTKAFITRLEEEWVPKYKEFPSAFKRRLLLLGTTNRDSFLGDETGERRWLPFDVGMDGEVLDVDALVADREQLWAEAVVLWKQHGVMWQEAERLAAAEHGRFKDEDPWTAVVRAWLLEDDPLSGGAPVDCDYLWGTNEVLTGALGRRAGDLHRGDQMRVGAILRSLGCLKKRVRHDGWRYRAFREKLVEMNDEG